VKLLVFVFLLANDRIFLVEAFACPPETLGVSVYKAAMCLSRCMLLIPQLAGCVWVHSFPLLFNPVIVSSSFHNPRYYRKWKNSTSNYKTGHYV